MGKRVHKHTSRLEEILCGFCGLQKVDTMQVDRLKFLELAKAGIWNKFKSQVFEKLDGFAIKNCKRVSKKADAVYGNGSLIIEERNGIKNEL